WLCQPVVRLESIAADALDGLSPEPVPVGPKAAMVAGDRSFVTRDGLADGLTDWLGDGLGDPLREGDRWDAAPAPGWGGPRRDAATWCDVCREAAPNGAITARSSTASATHTSSSTTGQRAQREPPGRPEPRASLSSGVVSSEVAIAACVRIRILAG